MNIKETSSKFTRTVGFPYQQGIKLFSVDTEIYNYKFDSVHYIVCIVYKGEF